MGERSVDTEGDVAHGFREPSKSTAQAPKLRNVQIVCVLTIQYTYIIEHNDLSHKYRVRRRAYQKFLKLELYWSPGQPRSHTILTPQASRLTADTSES